MSEIIAYASSTKPNHLWSVAQFNSALPKNRLDADIPLVSKTETEKDRELIKKMAGALQFILAFYEPGQRYLDTNAWTQAEAGGRAAMQAVKDAGYWS